MNKNNPETDISNIINQIHKSPFKLSLAITGGGTEAIGEILRHGSGSATILEAYVPYSPHSLEKFIGKKPTKYASAETAREMAMVAYQRALKLNKENNGAKAKNIIGIGVTCKLAKGSEERQGREHEIHFASQSYHRTSSCSIKIDDKLTREEEEVLTSLFTIYKIAELSGIQQTEAAMKHIIEKVSAAGNIIERTATVDEETARLLVDTLLSYEYANKKSVLIFKKDKKQISKGRLILSASFNPCHKNHILMAKIAAEKYQLPVTFEISMANVDKAPIDFISLNSRLKSLKEQASDVNLDSIYLTNAPLFADKAMIFPKSRFIIGTDTLNRLFNNYYYREDENKFSLLAQFKKLNTLFVVFQRKDIEPIIDEDIMQVCDIIPFEEYTDDGTSSTKIRMEKKD